MTSANPGAPHKPIPVLYQDEYYTVFDKPAGLLVIPSPKQEINTLTDIVNRESKFSEQGRLYPCHRLDRETSGVILFARGKSRQQLMMDAFQKRLVQKKYLAFVHGRLKQPMGEIKSEVEGFDRRKFSKKPRAKTAITRYKVIEAHKDFSVVEVNPITGRTNQIRIQFSQIGHPLVGEEKYAFRRDFDLRFKRVALHALELIWTHPIFKKQIIINSPLAKDMEAFLAKHR